MSIDETMVEEETPNEAQALAEAENAAGEREEQSAADVEAVAENTADAEPVAEDTADVEAAAENTADVEAAAAESDESDQGDPSTESVSAAMAEDDSADSDPDQRAQAHFGTWLTNLPRDVESIMDASLGQLENESQRRNLTNALNYLIKSVDLIDEGIEGLGYLEDAFVIRILVKRASLEGQLPENLAHLAEEMGLVRAFLGDQFSALQGFALAFSDSVVRGRNLDSILEDEAVRSELHEDLRGWMSRYKTPSFSLDASGLIKLRSYLAARLSPS